jgi:anti-anti-sigma factor
MEQSFSLKTELTDNRLVIATAGYVNNVGGEAIAQEFRRHFGNGVKHVVLNLAQSRVVNSIGISFLIEIIETLNEANGRLIFTNLDHAVEKMLAIMGVFNFAGKENSVEDALRAFEAQPSGDR